MYNISEEHNIDHGVSIFIAYQVEEVDHELLLWSRMYHLASDVHCMFGMENSSQVFSMVRANYHCHSIQYKQLYNYIKNFLMVTMYFCLCSTWHYYQLEKERELCTKQVVCEYYLTLVYIYIIYIYMCVCILLWW